MIIANKQEMYKLLNAGLLGNTQPSFSNVSDLARVYGRKGRFGIRSVESAGGGVFVPHLTFGCLVKELLTTFKDKTVNISPMVNDKHCIIQGNILDDYLHYSFIEKPFRDALATKAYHSYCPLKTRTILKHFMDQPSYENIERLQSLYPNHAIEFLVTSHNYGIYKWNTIIWEVRQY